MSFPVRLANSGENPVDLTPGTARIQLDFRGQSITSTTASRFTTTPVTGADTDLLLEMDEFIEIRLLALDFFMDPDLGIDTTFTIHVISEFGPVMTLFSGTTPSALPSETTFTLKP